MNTATNGYYARVALSFARKIDTDLIAFVRNVITLMTGNTQYPTPSPTLAEVTTSVNDFETAVHDALDGGKIAIATRNAAREALLALMRQLAAYVQGHCNADLLALISSGFDPVRAPSRAGTLPAPQNPRLSLTDKSGELLFKFDRVKNAYNYSIQTAPAASGPWEDEDLSTVSRVVGMRRGKLRRVFFLPAKARAGARGGAEFGTVERALRARFAMQTGPLPPRKTHRPPETRPEVAFHHADWTHFSSHPKPRQRPLTPRRSRGIVAALRCHERIS